MKVALALLAPAGMLFGVWYTQPDCRMPTMDTFVLDGAGNQKIAKVPVESFRSLDLIPVWSWYRWVCVLGMKGN